MTPRRKIHNNEYNIAKDVSQEKVIEASMGSATLNLTAHPITFKIGNQIAIDEEVANLLTSLAKQQGISPELALKKAVVTAAYLHDLTTSQGGKLLVQRRDNSVGEIHLK